MGYVTNESIVPAANYGTDLSTPNGNFSTHRGGAGTAGYLPHRLRHALVFNDIFGPARRVEQVIYSYATPIAFKIEGVWLIPDVTYSSTTSTKHATHLWKLQGRIEYIPFDASPEEIDRVVAGKQRYVPSRTTRHGIGSYIPGPNAE